MRLTVLAATVVFVAAAPPLSSAADRPFPAADPVCTGLRHETVAIYAPGNVAETRANVAWERARGLYLHDLRQADLAQRRDVLPATGYRMVGQLISADLEVLYAQVDRMSRGDTHAAAQDAAQALADLQAADRAADASPYAARVVAARDALLSAGTGSVSPIAEGYASLRVRLNRIIHDALCSGAARG